AGAGFEEARSSVAMHRLLNTATWSVPAAALAAAVWPSTVLGTVCASRLAAMKLRATPVAMVVLMCILQKSHLLGGGEFEDFVDVAVQRFGAVPIERRVAGHGVDAIATSG